MTSPIHFSGPIKSLHLVGEVVCVAGLSVVGCHDGGTRGHFRMKGRGGEGDIKVIICEV